MKRIKNLFAIVGLLSVSALLIFAVQDAPSDINLEKKIINDYNVYALNVPENLDFAGEAMPLSNPDILERMDRELLVNTYWQSNGLLMFKRANKYYRKWFAKCNITSRSEGILANYESNWSRKWFRD